MGILYIKIHPLQISPLNLRQHDRSKLVYLMLESTSESKYGNHYSLSTCYMAESKRDKMLKDDWDHRIRLPIG